MYDSIKNHKILVKKFKKHCFGSKWRIRFWYNKSSSSSSIITSETFGCFLYSFWWHDSSTSSISHWTYEAWNVWVPWYNKRNRLWSNYRSSIRSTTKCRIYYIIFGRCQLSKKVSTPLFQPSNIQNFQKISKKAPSVH